MIDQDFSKPQYYKITPSQESAALTYFLTGGPPPVEMFKEDVMVQSVISQLHTFLSAMGIPAKDHARVFATAVSSYLTTSSIIPCDDGREGFLTADQVMAIVNDRWEIF